VLVGRRVLLAMIQEKLATQKHAEAHKQTHAPARTSPCTFAHARAHAHTHTTYCSSVGASMQRNRDASSIVPGAEGGFSWVRKRAGYRAKHQHLQSVRERHLQDGHAGR